MATLARLVTAFLALGLGKATLIFYLYYVLFEENLSCELAN